MPIEARRLHSAAFPMSSGPSLASVVFLKIAEFARRRVSEQARLRAQLEAVVAVTSADLAPESRIVLEASDGIAVVVLANPPAALSIAERVLAAGPAGLLLSIGVNHGAVRAVGEEGDEGVIGDGVATAAGVADFAPAGAVLLSRSFHDALAEVAPALAAGLRPAGIHTDAGLRTHELFRPDKDAALRRRRRFLLLGAATVAGFVGVGAGIRLAVRGRDKFSSSLVARARASANAGTRSLRGWLERLQF
jgi:hypothetical protein